MSQIAARITFDSVSLPLGWRQVRLDEVCEKRTGIRDPSIEPAKQFKYVDISSVDNVVKRINDPKTLFGRNAPSRARQVIREGDVLVSTTRPNLNAVALVPPELDNEVCSTGFCVLRANHELSADYLFAFVQSKEFIQPLSDLVKGALYPAVTDSQVRAQSIPLPPFAEQKRIATIINEQMSAVERARAAAEAQLKAAKDLPAAYLREVFESSEAQQWQERKIGEICAVTKLAGFEYTKYIKYVPDGEYIALRAQNVRNEGLDLRNVVRISREVASALYRSKLNKNDVVMTFIGANIGEATWIDESDTFYCSPNIAKITPNPEFVDNRFLTLAIQSRPFQQQIQEINASTAQQSLSMRDIRNFIVPVPSLEKQKYVAARLLEGQLSVKLLRERLQGQLDAIYPLPATLLRQAFTGKL